MLTLYFSTHEAEALGTQFSDLLTKCDVLVVENGSSDGTEEDRTELFNLLSNGKITPEDIQALASPWQPFGAFEKRLGKLLFRSNKRIELERSPWGDHEGARFLAFFSRPPEAKSLDEALEKLKAYFGEAGKMVLTRDKAYAIQLSRLLSTNPSSNILAMMGAGHQRALTSFLDEGGVLYSVVASSQEWISPLSSLALEEIENGKDLNRLELLRCLAEFFPPHHLVQTQERKLVRWWAEGMNENQLTQYLNKFYSARKA